MDNTTIPNETVFRKCLSLLPFDDFSCSYLDNGVKKLTTANLHRIAVAAQLGNWASYTEMEERIRAMKDSEELFGLSSISGSQLSRRINDLPTSHPQRLFFTAVKQLKELTHDQKGIPSLGRLNLIDSSSLHLAPQMGKWAYVSQDKNSVKLHTRLVVDSPEIGYPDQVIPSTGNVDDREVVLELVTDPGATYVMDRGYVDYTKMDQWVKDEIDFAMRINAKHKANILETYETPQKSRVLLDAKVIMGSAYIQMQNPVRLVEFTDDHGRYYRVVTTRWDLKAEEIAELYRCRWMIELFFKWLKQHLRLVKLQSTKPQGIWNQIFFAMTAFCLVLYIRLLERSGKTTWQVLNLLRIYADRTWKAFWQVLHRTPERTSKGRQKSQQPREAVPLNGAGVAKVKPVGERRCKTAKYLK